MIDIYLISLRLLYPMVILYVDDDADDRAVFAEIVQEIDPSIILLSAKDAQEALDILSNDFTALPHVIFLDINMPMMDGYECLEKIKSDNRLSKIPVVLYSTTNNPVRHQKYKHLQAEFLTKPTTYSHAFQILKSVIKQ
jgi:CheY-like chemotaxis protein